MKKEIRVKDPETGGEKGSKIERFDLIPVGPLFEVSKLYGVGARKYAIHNWRRGYAWSLSFAAACRHLWKFWRGESYDKELKCHHLACVVFHCFALMEFEKHHKNKDDRYNEIKRKCNNAADDAKRNRGRSSP